MPIFFVFLGILIEYTDVFGIGNKNHLNEVVFDLLSPPLVNEKISL